MDLEVDAVGAGGDRRARQRLGEAALAAGLLAGGAGQLQRMGDVVDHRDAVVVHQLEAAHVHHQVAVAEGVAALGDRDPLVAGAARLLDRPAHVAGGHELALLDVQRAAGAGGGDDEIGLAAEEGGHLQHVADLGRGAALVRLVDVGEQRQPGLGGDHGQDLEPRLEAGAAEALDRAAVGLVVGGLEDDRHLEAASDGGHRAGRRQRLLLALDDAGAGDDGQPARAGGDTRRQLHGGWAHAAPPPTPTASGASTRRLPRCSSAARM